MCVCVYGKKKEQIDNEEEVATEMSEKSTQIRMERERERERESN